MLYELDGVAPEVADSAWIAPTAVLIGKVRIGPNASVWWNAVLRGDNEWIELGEGSNVQDNAVCHTDVGAPLTVGAGVTVGHTAILHSCTIGDGALVGMGASVLNHAQVGQEALIGAGALVAQGKSIPARSLAVGAPARVVRDLTDEQVAAIAKGCSDYVAKAVRYRSHCQAV